MGKRPHNGYNLNLGKSGGRNSQRMNGADWIGIIMTALLLAGFLLIWLHYYP